MRINKTWVPACESLGLKTRFYGIDDHFYKYATTLYYAVLMYLINETLPTVLYERVFVMLVALVSAVVNQVIFSNVAVILQEIGKKDVQRKEEDILAVTAMLGLGLPKDYMEDTRDKIMKAFYTRDEP
jgi:hypothetical protein